MNVGELIKAIGGYNPELEVEVEGEGVLDYVWSESGRLVLEGRDKDGE